MLSNIEMKAKARDFSRPQALAEQLSDTPGVLIHQEDTFFHTPKGRLKLRVFSPKHGELVYYERENISGPKQAKYFISRTTVLILSKRRSLLLWVCRECAPRGVKME